MLTLISFASALMSGLGYLLFTNTGDHGWRTVGRLGFRLHSLAVIGIVVTLFVMLFQHWFEYDYVWKHSNTEMPLRYIASCFWEGQEGSFLLWTFWGMVLGNILIWREGRKADGVWEGPVLAVFSLVQVFLASMLLGIHILDIRIGSSPFLLIRELPENLGLPWTKLAGYMERIPQFKDGRGLNPLLQNYWMVIHPPTLFLGFACTLVPFSFAIAALWRNKLKDWMTPALPWTFFGIMVLGTGILMGGAWAYEALSFGGFWAWDPVEKGSLIPWITLVSTGHLLMINKRKETSTFTTLLLALGTFLLVLYSSFLTRSGVLGDTSVHSFTGEGMLPGLLVFLMTFIAVSVAMLNTHREWRLYTAGMALSMLLLAAMFHTYVPAVVLFGLFVLIMTVVAYATGPFHTEGDENIWSREFWLFIGALVLLLSAVQIMITTSIPVFNMLVEPFAPGIKRAPPVDAIAHYNKWQVPFAFIVTILVAVGQYLRYKDTDRRKFLKDISLSLIGSLVITVLAAYWLRFQLEEGTLVALLFATVFAILANAVYFLKVLKGSIRVGGPSVAHMGFGLVLLGALISTSRKQEISPTAKAPACK